MQSAVRLIYPAQCPICRALVESSAALCGSCWADTPFLGRMVCDCCGLPLPGAAEPEETILCDDCLGADRAWSRGRAALVYRDNARKIVLGIKHGDRHDLVRPAAAWLAQALVPILRDDMLVTCVPLHWRRLLRRRYNQAALLSGALAKQLGLEHCPDLLHRPAATRMLDGLGRAERAAHLAGAIVPHRRRGARMAGRSILIIDDVMTSGATLDAAAMACRAAGAVDVRVGVLARVALEV